MSDAPAQSDRHIPIICRSWPPKNWQGVPEYMRGAVCRYIENGIPPGDFLTAVLRNDLREACGRADDTNRHALFDYVSVLYCYAPAGSWGSPAEFRAWVARGGMTGKAAA